MKDNIPLLLGLILTGCVPSWNPLYTEKDIVFDRALVGTWMPSDAKEQSKERWVFVKGSNSVYQLHQTDEESRKAIFEARLVKLKEQRFLDIYLTNVEGANLNLNALATLSLAPAHLILKVEQIEPVLKIAAMNPDWMSKFVKKQPGAIAHRVVSDGHIILTASTTELQKFVLDHLSDQEFFGGAMELKRQTTPGK